MLYRPRPSTVRAYEILKLGSARCRLVICPSEDLAQQTCSDLRALASMGLKSSPEIEVVFVPAWTHSPYSSIQPSLRIRHERLSAFTQALEPPNSTLFVSTPAALIQATIPVEVFRALSFELRPKETELKREELRTRLIQAGYEEVSTVEDPGTFALRGEIVDLFRVQDALPVRIEFFDTQVDRIRNFAPDTQRTLSGSDRESRTSLWITPAQEVLSEGNSQGNKKLRETVKAHSDAVDLPRSVRERVLSDLEAHAGLPDSWAPFAYAQPGRWLDALLGHGDLQCFWLDPQFCLDEARKSIEPLRDEYERHKSERLLCPPEKLYPALDDLVTLLAPRTVASFALVAGGDQDIPFQAIEKIGLDRVQEKFSAWRASGWKIWIGAGHAAQAERIRYLLKERNILSGYEVLEGDLSESAALPSEGMVLLNQATLLGQLAAQLTKSRSTKKSQAKTWAGLQALTDLAVGDAVVHYTHGIGIYKGLVRLDLTGAQTDFLQVEYERGDKLYVPVYKLSEIQKYTGGSESIRPDRLGGPGFEKAKTKARESARKLAFDLVQLHAGRKLKEGIRIQPPETLYKEFESRFPYEETPDQLSAIEAVHQDLESGQPMDRLVCGDVGFGKTEVALRAAFRCVEAGYQVAVLVPTTVLAFQHEQSFRQRFSGYPITIEGLSRFKSRAEQAEILARVASGQVDIVIGTHRLLSSDVKWNRLALVVIDEEQRFGVEHKEKLKTVRINAHLLTLTATPIPRTLHMALSGLREVSIISTPPIDRLPTRTFVSHWDDELITQAIRQELARSGQVFFLHNRVQSIDRTAEKIRELVPEARIGIAHGQMSETQLEKKMLEFYRAETNVLLCTTIIESGLDIPLANTMIIDQAENFGLGQLYQLRGRVGRSDRRAYCYLLVGPKSQLSEDAKRRLEVIQRFVELGSGFAVANHDLEIRGGGNLLGPEQSGQIAAVGFDLYLELLEEAIGELRGSPVESEESHTDPEIKIPFPSFLSEQYVPDIHQRLALYRRLSGARDESSLQMLESELVDRFGPLPLEAQNLLWVLRTKILLKHHGITRLVAGAERSALQLGPQCKLSPAKIVTLVKQEPLRLQLTPDSRLIVTLVAQSPKDLFLALESLLNRCYP